MKSTYHAGLCLLALTALFIPTMRAAEPKVRIVAIGDSITRGVRPGVKEEETFASLLQEALRKKGIEAEILNVGIGGEQTDQALARLKTAVIDKKPTVVTIMYGTCDSYVEGGKKETRLSAEQYGKNLRRLVKELRAAGIKPILMTPPRWGDKATADGNGDHPNLRLEPYAKVCRAVAAETKTPLVDHFADWSKQAKAGTNISTWMTDECHPNPEGHKVIAKSLLPVVQAALKAK